MMAFLYHPYVFWLRHWHTHGRLTARNFVRRHQIRSNRRWSSVRKIVKAPRSSRGMCATHNGRDISSLCGRFLLFPNTKEEEDSSSSNNRLLFHAIFFFNDSSLRFYSILPIGRRFFPFLFARAAASYKQPNHIHCGCEKIACLYQQFLRLYRPWFPVRD